MPRIQASTPDISVRLYKTISRTSIDGQTAVSERYAGKDEYIDLTPFLNDRSSVRTSKSVREPSGGFVITFADKVEKHSVFGGELESVYGLVEPMDMIEIRMWGGVGVAPAETPIVMRGFVSSVSRPNGVSDDGKPVRQVMVTGQDFGKIWQTFQVIYLAAYAEGQALLTNFALWEMFGVEVENALESGEFVRKMVEKVINPHLDGLIPKDFPVRAIQTGDSIAVAHGVVNNSYQATEGSIWDILKTHGDVGVWNELYVEDREDGVHCVYRPVPAQHITANAGAKNRLIQDDAVEPVYVNIYDDTLQVNNLTRTDANVANFFWVNNSRFDLIDEMQRKLASIPKDDEKVSLKDYPNSAVKYYGVRPMYAATQQAGEDIKTLTSGQLIDTQDERSDLQLDWITERLRILREMNRDNVVLESGTATVKGGPMRDGGTELMRAGDYALFHIGKIQFEAYVTQIDHDYQPFQSYITNLTLERGTGFVVRSQMGGGSESPWLAEQARRNGGAS